MVCNHHNALHQGKMVYETTGVYPAESFFKVTETSGRAKISVAQSLMLDSLMLDSYTVSYCSFPTQQFVL